MSKRISVTEGVIDDMVSSYFDCTNDDCDKLEQSIMKAVTAVFADEPDFIAKFPHYFAR